MKDGIFEHNAERIRIGILDAGEQRIGVEIGVLLEVCLIKEISPVMIGKPGLLGVMNLRGNMIPVIDPYVLCGLPPMISQPKIAAVLGLGGKSIALAVDRISGLSEIARDEIQSLLSEGSKPSTVSGGFYMGDQAINMIDAKEILAISGLPCSSAMLRTPRKGIVNGARAFLTFEAGGAAFGLDAVRIFGTVPGQAISQDSLSVGACLGTIKHHKRRVPVMDSNLVFGLGEPRNRVAPEVVIMRFPEDRLLGFAVDVISRIQLISTSDLQPTNTVFGSSKACFSSICTDDAGGQTFILDADVLENDSDLRTIAGLSDPPVTVPSGASGDPIGSHVRGGNQLVKEAVRYLIFSAGRRMATPIEQLVRILEPPKTVTPVPHGTKNVIGLFTIDGSVVPLVSMNRIASSVQETAGTRHRVILVGPSDRRVGFLVTSVDGIETSSWRTSTNEVTHSDAMVHFKAEGFRAVLPRMDLEWLASEVNI